jgi:hypothetical protein
MLTCSPLKLWSIDYYNRTAREAGQAATDAAAANGGLGEYYSGHDTRAPVWLVAGDAKKAAELVGLSDEQRAGGLADLDTVQRWLDAGIAPNECCGRRFAEGDNHGIDMTFCAPKSLSLLRAYGDDVVQKAVLDAHNTGVREAVEYVHKHAGYTRVHNNTRAPQRLRKPAAMTPISIDRARCGNCSADHQRQQHRHLANRNLRPLDPQANQVGSLASAERTLLRGSQSERGGTKT